jgi:hypothetical protein
VNKKGKPLPVGEGIAPWIIADAELHLRDAMATNDWTLAARWAATIGHYTADIHQPLHTTKRFDDGNPPGTGIHWRWEEELPKMFWRGSMLQPEPAQYLTNVWSAVLSWVEHSHNQYEQIYEADQNARNTGSSNLESRAYYQALWDGTREMFLSQANLAATDLASLWYTAWVDAGRPKIPPPPDAAPRTSVWIAAASVAAPSAMPFLIVFGIVAVLVVGLSLRKEMKK